MDASRVSGSEINNTNRSIDPSNQSASCSVLPCCTCTPTDAIILPIVFSLIHQSLLFLVCTVSYNTGMSHQDRSSHELILPGNTSSSEDHGSPLLDKHRKSSAFKRDALLTNRVNPKVLTLRRSPDASSRRTAHGSQFLRWLLPTVFLVPLLLLQAVRASEVVELPPLLDSDDIAYFFERNDLEGLHWALSSVFAASERMPRAVQQPKVQPLPQQLVARGGGSSYTTAYKLKMDLEQAEYLGHQLKETQPELAAYFQEQVAPIYRNVLKNIPALEDLQRTNGLYAFRQADWDAGIAAVYNKALYLQPLDGDDDTPLGDGSRKPLLNPALDTQRIQQEWFGGSNSKTTNSNTGIVVIDDILSQEALNNIRKVLLESTVFFQTKMPLSFGGYAGAYIDDGLHHKILLQLSMELSKALPRIMKGHPLRYLWAYKYDAEFTSGINLHADQAAINVNLWITPDDSNLDPTSGGLVVFTAKPPSSWSFEDYNTHPDKVVEELLRPTDFANVTIPHKQNRAVLFDSALFHQTDVYKFKKGYTNRRINLTLLYGTMQTQQQQEGAGKTEL